MRDLVDLGARQDRRAFQRPQLPVDSDSRGRAPRKQKVGAALIPELLQPGVDRGGGGIRIHGFSILPGAK